jgi:hypothetical protein
VLVYQAGNQVYSVPSGVTRLGNAGAEDKEELIFPGAPLARAIPLPIYIWPVDAEAVASVSVVRYERDAIELVISGTGAEARVNDGAVEMLGGTAAPIGVEIRGGLFALRSEATYKVEVEPGGSRRPYSLEAMPDPDSGALVLRDILSNCRLTITPAG